ncbi:divergent polysaccharide deacetylase family protein [Arenibaculum sp.]|uniref:divergent polysaccharide deacetylase family protein n=1 Tax=Arenibaculum sp. TaxID=2865862 RepID=UPI002E12C9EE|nr:divergent polysaccharide deacetylase family protein [Arenibaculum sp.]
MLRRLGAPVPGLRGAAAGAAGEPEVDLDDASGEAAASHWRLAIPAVPLLLLGGLVLWLSLSAEQTMRERLARIPSIVVPVIDMAGGDGVLPAPTDAASAGSGTSDPNPVDFAVEMAPAPDPALVEQTPDGALPRVGEDGRTPWQTYARPFVHGDVRPRVAVVMAELGMSSAATRDALARLPGAVTLAFPSHAPDLPAWIEAARRDGHEVLLDLPAEPDAYPKDDPGPGALMTMLPSDENLRRLRLLLARGTGYVGVTTLSGSGFSAAPEAVGPVAQELARRGLALLDARASSRSALAGSATAAAAPRAIADIRVDRSPSPAAIDAELAALLEIARRDGTAVGVVSPYPVTLERLGLWLPKLAAEGVALAPLTAVVNRQPDR